MTGTSKGAKMLFHCDSEVSTDGKILWPAFTVKLGHKVGCESCPLGSEACAEFRRSTPSGECPCDVYDTYTDYIKAEEESY